MSPERWQRVKAVFHEALSQRPDRLPEYLRRHCPDAALRAEVDSLLAAYQVDPDFLEHAARVTHEDSGHGTPDPLTDAQVGPYRLGRRIAIGGMGAVYAGVRADQTYRKEVAVKVLRSDRWVDPHRQAELIRRFHIERQALADFDHPYIARMLDGGAMADGTPYLVMDMINGDPIDDFCDRERLNTTERLRLFVKVCQAVHYAHQHLVVHRDLKPGNILVSGDGTPHLLDFGIAKVLDGAQPGRREPTQTAFQPMTPEYASPEQVSGRGVTTATDVYSLGVVLYELLTGHRPYSLRDVPPHDIARVIREEQPEKPSTAVTRVSGRMTRDGSSWIALTPQSVSLPRERHPQRLHRRLRGDLDMIVLMALRKEPQRRFASVQQFADDIQRHLDGLPVIARKDAFGYRLSKFVQRHRWGVAAASVTILALAAAGIVTALSAGEARRQRDVALARQKQAAANLDRATQAERDARAEADAAEQIADYLVDIFQVADPFRPSTDSSRAGLGTTAGDLLKRGMEHVEGDLTDRPQVQARLFEVLGRINANLGEYDEAQRLFERSLASRKTLLGEDHLDVAAAKTALGSLLRARGQHQECRHLLESALEIRLRHLGDDHLLVAESLYELAKALEAGGNLAGAEDHYRRALSIHRLAGDDAGREIGVMLGDLGALLAARNALAEAEVVQREAIEALRLEYGAQHPFVASALTNLANLLQTSRDYQSATPLYREALDVYRASLGREHPFIAVALTNLGTVLEAQGDAVASLPLHDEALALLRRIHGPDHPNVAGAANNMAMALQSAGRIDDAEILFRETVELRRRILGSDHPALAVSLNNLGLLLGRRQEHIEAEAMFREAAAIRRDKLGLDHPKTLDTLANLGVTLGKLVRYDESETVLREVLEARRRTLPAGHQQVAFSAASLGKCLIAQELYESAEPLMRESFEALRESRGLDDARTQEILAELIVANEKLDRIKESQELRLMVSTSQSGVP